jgi:hypothetical protein
MGLWSRLVERLAGTEIDRLVSLRVRESLPAGLVDQDDQLWRRVSRTSRFAEDAFVQEISLQQVYKLYTCNPLAKWLLEMTRDLITAEGVEVTSEDDRVAEVLQSFWHHDLNLMDINLPQMVLELGLWGEQCWPAFVPDAGGIVSLGLVSSDMIKSVVHDPGNCALPIGVVLKDASGQPGAKLKIIYNKPDAELFTPRVQDLRAHEYTDGECFWFKINTTRESSRGLSDLFTLSDWLDGYESLLFNLRDRDDDLRAFAWDVTLMGLDQQQINAWLANTPKPEPGSWFAHNENVILDPKTPELHAGDTTMHASMYRKHITSSMGFPIHWFGGADESNLATAEATHPPVFKRYLQRQRYVKYMLDHVLKYQLRIAVEGGLIHADKQDQYKIEMPQMVTEDLTKISASLTQLTAACAQAVDLGWIEADTAQRLFATVASRLGVDVPQDPIKAKERAHTTPDYADTDTDTDSDSDNAADAQDRQSEAAVNGFTRAWEGWD